MLKTLIQLWRVATICCLCLLVAAVAQGQKRKKYKYRTLKQHRKSMQYVQVEDGKMAYLDLGNPQSDPILLVHGIPTSSWLYRYVADGLQKQGFRVIVPDLLGYGASDKPKDYALYSIEKQGIRLKTLLDTLKIPKITIAMHDAGGLWTWELLKIDPKCAKRLIILNTIAYREGFHPPMEFKEGGLFGKFYVGLYKSKMSGATTMGMTLKKGTYKHKFPKKVCEGYCVPMREGADRAIYNFFTSFRTTFQKLKEYNQLFEQMDLPVAVIWGQKDKILVSRQQVPLLKKSLRIKDENIHLLPDAVHFIQEEKPQMLIDTMSKFMRKY